MYDVRDRPAPVLADPPVRSGPPRWAGHALLACGLALVPWLVVLAVTLPSASTASGGHWATAWVGLDAFEAAGLIATGVLATRRARLLPPAAAATAMLLVTDAWFDTTTAAPGQDFAVALAMALAAELPLAAACAVLAVRALPR
ncbi:hypothetical protein SAMN05216251_13212 [Actinacidiphila alni]|uniref:Uncharacterized protein n=1 Tax=Actinacidiphila alni TaxID=380248 RepID=A0A1I2LZV5_9ACTN|nr:A4/G1 family peptidase [Actinacidiphila alni]SFF84795.1 hypothetical protein SAMN05216251_13212 [Actinacidiphila alni]